MIFFADKNFINSDPVTDGLPWITESSWKFLKKYLNSNMRVFEWGSGGSTIFFSILCRSVVSIEHDKLWFKKIKKEIFGRFLKNIKIENVLPQKLSRKKKDNILFQSCDSKFKDYSFEIYCEKILDFPNNYFDIIFVDGRARNGCIKCAIGKLKKGGIIILDDSQRKEYSAGIEMLNKWKARKYYGLGPGSYRQKQTSVFFKPS